LDDHRGGDPREPFLSAGPPQSKIRTLQKLHVCRLIRDMNSDPSLPPEKVRQHNELYRRACRLLEGLVILDDRAHKSPGFFGRRRLRKAVQLFEQVIDLNPANWQSMILIGKAFQSLGELEPALSWFLRADDCVPGRPAVAKEVGFAAGRLGQHDIAIRVMQAAAKEHPNDPALHLNLGLSCLMSGKSADAREAFTRAVELEPERDMNRRLLSLARDVEAGKRRCPKTETELAQTI
jgi:tetratricopeptide (TPR) repeat protein